MVRPRGSPADDAPFTGLWESERWSFYIPLGGNEEAIRALADIVKKTAPQGGCFIGEHRLEGCLDIRSVGAAAHAVRHPARVGAARQGCSMGGEGDPLYKGGLKGMMRPWGKRRRPEKAEWPDGRREVARLRRLEVRGLYEETAGRLHGAGGWASGGFGFGRPRPSFKDRCWDAVHRLEVSGLRTAGDLTRLTKRQLLAAPGVGRTTAELAEWMLEDAGLGFAAPNPARNRPAL